MKSDLDIREGGFLKCGREFGGVGDVSILIVGMVLRMYVDVYFKYIIF